MATRSFSRDSFRSHRRDSSSSQNASSKQRPRLLRSSVTEPSITTPNVIRGQIGISNSPQKATELLRVYSPTSHSPDLVPRHAEPIMINHTHQEHHASSPSSAGSQDTVLGESPSGYYFSFPNFDDWKRDKQDLEKDNDD